MFNRPSREEIALVKSKYTEGMIVELDFMNDDYAPPVGTRGTVTCVDDIGTVHVRWENGSRLGLAYGVDKFHIIE